MINFSNLHPVVSALYFVSVLVITMFTANPILLFVALLGGILFYTKTEKGIHFLKEFRFYLVLIVIITLTNPLFSHDGVTPLFFLNGNPITLEALLYGVDIAIMLVAVMYWFKCFNKIMTEDKLLFLFGKISPKISLLLSSALRFIPLLKIQAARIRQSQKAMGLFASEAWTDKLRGSMRVYSALITWALENAIDTGSSMKARGYGLKGRSHYSIFTFRKSDALLMAAIMAMDAIIVMVMATGQLDFSFYPTISATTMTIYNFLAMITFAVLVLLPFILEVKEGLQWKYYRSKI
ncbi:MAG: energy-coupling factor transporter transmembrane protein EcfT [Tyzzerella sp.]|nr:energy-coupling factor transporter transmembrane protein EcfT [Tyzzerella sp.]